MITSDNYNVRSTLTEENHFVKTQVQDIYILDRMYALIIKVVCSIGLTRNVGG